MVKYDFNFAVIGAGSAGLTAAGFARSLGISTVMIEQEHIGGDCTWSGCVPSKALIHASNEQRLKDTKSDYKRTFEYVTQKIHDIYKHEGPDVWETKGIEVVIGSAELLDEHTIKVTAENQEIRTLSVGKICIATGAKPLKPQIPGLWDTSQPNNKVWTYQDFWKQKELPKSIAVIGGGPIGAEIAQATCRLGHDVTLIADVLLPREVEVAREIVAKSMARDGINHVKAKLTSVKRLESSSSYQLRLSTGDVVRAEAILVAAGRECVVPMNIENLLELGPKGGLVTNKVLKCYLKGKKKVASNIFAAGDCIEANLQFTHYAGKQGYYCARNAFLVGSQKGTVPLEVPRCTFTSPEIASIGYSSVEEAIAGGNKKAMMLKYEGFRVDRAVTDDAQDETIFEVILSDDKTTNAKILGANIIAPNAGEVLAPICLAMKANMPIINFADVIQPYPTYSFGLMQLIGTEVTKRFANSSKAAVGKALNF